MLTGRMRLCGLVTVMSLSVTACNDSESPLTTSPQTTCLDRAVFGEPAASPYVLPYPVGSTERVTQSYCFDGGGHRGTFAYDFAIPLGGPVHASRAGTVIVANDQYADSDHIEGHENNVFVEHGDGTVVRYTHLQQGSLAVAVGDLVSEGQMLGRSGSSGNTGGVAHLHFEVFRSRSSYAKSESLPVNFRNADGELDGRNGLAMGRDYTATPY